LLTKYYSMEETVEKYFILAYCLCLVIFLLVFWLNNVVLCTKLLDSLSSKVILVSLSVMSGAFSIYSFLVGSGIHAMTYYYVKFIL